MIDFEMVENADVKLKLSVQGNEGSDRTRNILTMDVAGRRHEFGTKSRLYKQLNAVPLKDLQERYSGGKFFFLGDNLIDMRDSNYTGFHHSDDSLAELMKHVGVSDRKEASKMHGHSFSGNYGSLSNEQVLMRQWGQEALELPSMDEGGQFNAAMAFLWNPFYKDVRTSLGIERLICANGMTVARNFLSYTVPVVNQHEENLEIAYKRMQQKVQTELSRKLDGLQHQRASVATVGRLFNHVEERLEGMGLNNGFFNPEANKVARTRLRELSAVINPEKFCPEYTQAVHGKGTGSVAAKVPSHLTCFDAWNVATELQSHTGETPKSSNRALNMIANDLMFTTIEKDSQATMGVSPNVSAFSDPNAAFMGAGEVELLD